ncbi:MAG: hypothetical protein RR198_04730 [Oscillospiraceae bacterium]
MDIHRSFSKGILSVFYTIIILAAFSGCTAHKNTDIQNNLNLKALSTGQTANFAQGNDYGYYETANPKRLVAGFNVLYTDYSTKNKVVLCSSASCEHAGTSCTGYIQGTPLRIFTLKDKIIIFSLMQENGEYFKNIISADLNGENHKILYTMNQNESEGGEYFCDNENIYFVITKPVTKDKDLLSQQFLIKLNIYTGEIKEILNLSEKFNNYYVNVIGSYNDELIVKIISTKMIIESIKIDGTSGTLAKVELSFDNSNVTYHNQYAYFVNYDNRCFVRKNIETGEEKTLNWHSEENFNIIDSSFGNVIDEKILFSVAEISNDNGISTRKDKLYYIDFDENKMTEIALRYTYDGMSKPVVIVAQTSDSLLVMNGIEDVVHAYPENDKGIISDIVPTPQYGILSKNDFWQSNPNYYNISYTV